MQRRDFLRRSMLAGLALPMTGLFGAAMASPAQAATGGALLPRRLNPGDTVAMVSPSAAMDDPFNFQLAEEALQALGLKVQRGASLAARRGHLAGTDAQRAADINQAFADANIAAIVCARGGSGAARILPLLDYQTIGRNPKPLLGYSDITALHNAIHSQTGLVTFHGPNGHGSWNRFNAEQFGSMFFRRELMTFANAPESSDELVQRNNRSQTITSGRATGRLLGGNLTVLTALAGSKYLPDFNGAVLFLEDVSEAPYRVDRMFSTLKLMGVLDQVAGVIFGECTDCNPGGGYGSLHLSEILADYLKPLGVPAYSGAMIGHIPRQFILPVGAMVEMDADLGRFRMLQPVFAR